MNNSTTIVATSTNTGLLEVSASPVVAAGVVKIEKLRNQRTKGVVEARDKALLNAIYGHIRAVRALGQTQVSTREIADALSIPIADVNRTLAALKKKGVAPARK